MADLFLWVFKNPCVHASQPEDSSYQSAKGLAGHGGMGSFIITRILYVGSADLQPKVILGKRKCYPCCVLLTLFKKSNNQTGQSLGPGKLVYCTAIYHVFVVEHKGLDLNNSLIQ